MSKLLIICLLVTGCSSPTDKAFEALTKLQNICKVPISLSVGFGGWGEVANATCTEVKP